MVDTMEIEKPSRSLPVRSISPEQGTEPAFMSLPISPLAAKIPDIRIEVRRGIAAGKI